MLREDPSYVLLNGERAALTPSRWGSIAARVGERARIFFVCGGPNLSSHFHPIGNVFTKAWANGSLAGEPERWVQTQHVPPGCCAVFEIEFPVPGEVKLVDHALTRVLHKGMMGSIDVKGPPNPAIFDAGPTSVA
jgi:nitrite reductase (NO-forming)